MQERCIPHDMLQEIQDSQRHLFALKGPHAVAPGPLKLITDEDEATEITVTVRECRIRLVESLSVAERADLGVEAWPAKPADTITLVYIDPEVIRGRMRLWYLRRVGRVDYDENDAAVIQAASERQARRIASEMSGVENRDRANSPWLSEFDSSCEALEPTGNTPGVILASFNAG